MTDTDWEIEDYQLDKKSKSINEHQEYWDYDEKLGSVLTDHNSSQIKYYDEVLCEVKIKLVRDFNKLSKTEYEKRFAKQKEIKPWTEIEEVCIGYGR